MAKKGRSVSGILIALVTLGVLGLAVLVVGATMLVREGSDEVDAKLGDIDAEIDEAVAAVERELSTTTLPDLPPATPRSGVVDVPPNQALWEALALGGDEEIVTSTPSCREAATTPLSNGDGSVVTWRCGDDASSVIVNTLNGSIILRTRELDGVRGSLTKVVADSISDAADLDDTRRRAGPCFDTLDSVAGATTRVSLLCGTPDGRGSVRFDFVDGRQVGRSESNLS